MATRNYVPRANGEGSIGTEKKHWGGAFFDKLAVRTLEVAGIRYNLEENGYICFGPLFGGFIMQWGVKDASVGWLQDEKGAYIDIPYNIAQTTLVRPIAVHYGGNADNLLSIIAGWHANEATAMRFRRVNIKGTQAYGSIQWILFGKE